MTEQRKSGRAPEPAGGPTDGSGPEPTYRPTPTSSGVGRVLVAVYALFALAACARAGVQLATRFQEAPLAYVLSAFAGAVYVLATIGLAGRGDNARRLAWVAVLVELAGVLVVGTLSLALPIDFPRATVWSGYGAGYGWIPLVLPVFGLLWLRRTGAVGRGSAGPTPRRQNE